MSTIIDVRELPDRWSEALSIVSSGHEAIPRARLIPSWDDLLYEVDVRRSIEAGLNDCHDGRTVPVAEVRRRLGLPA